MYQPKRKWDTGMIRPYRPVPAGFREAYLRLGYSKELREEFRTNDRCLARWIEECGGEVLRQERSAITGSALKPHRRSKRYVMGRTLTAVRVTNGEG
jgi:hypothetical protein